MIKEIKSKSPRKILSLPLVVMLVVSQDWNLIKRLLFLPLELFHYLKFLNSWLLLEVVLLVYKWAPFMLDLELKSLSFNMQMKLFHHLIKKLLKTLIRFLPNKDLPFLLHIKFYQVKITELTDKSQLSQLRVDKKESWRLTTFWSQLEENHTHKNLIFKTQV